ncbi:hypothetical protein HDU77_003788, partial [Chytriomyces hyalinus]
TCDSYQQPSYQQKQQQQYYKSNGAPQCKAPEYKAPEYKAPKYKEEYKQPECKSLTQENSYRGDETYTIESVLAPGYDAYWQIRRRHPVQGQRYLHIQHHQQDNRSKLP